MSSRSGAIGRVLCALDIEHDDWGPLAIASLMAEYFRVPLDALHAAADSVWEGRTQLVGRLIAEHSAQERLERRIASLTTSIDVTACVRRGVAGDVILEQAIKSRAGLIVLGSANRRSFGGGSHRLATTVASSATAAVLTVSSDARPVAVQRILLPITTAAAASPALEWATALARRFGASVSVVQVACWATWPGRGLVGLSGRSRDMERRRATLLHQSIEDLQHADIAVTEEPEQLDAAGLAQLASERAFDLTVLGLPATSDPGCEQAALAARLRQCSLVPLLSTRAQLRTSSQATWAASGETAA